LGLGKVADLSSSLGILVNVRDLKRAAREDSVSRSCDSLTRWVLSGFLTAS